MPAAVLAVPSSNLDHDCGLGGEEPGETGTPCAGALDTDDVHVTEAVQPPPQLPITGRCCREGFGVEHAAALIERSCDVCVLVRVDAARDANLEICHGES